MALIESNGWVERVKHKDRRIRSYKVSTAGEAVLQIAMPLWSALHERVLHEIGPDAWLSARSPIEALWRFAIQAPAQSTEQSAKASSR